MRTIKIVDSSVFSKWWNMKHGFPRSTLTNITFIKRFLYFWNILNWNFCSVIYIESKSWLLQLLSQISFYCVRKQVIWKCFNTFLICIWKSSCQKCCFNLLIFCTVVVWMLNGVKFTLCQCLICSDSMDFNKAKELEAMTTMNIVYGVIVALIICSIFLVVLLLTYCYYKNNPQGRKRRSQQKSSKLGMSVVLDNS